MDDGRPTAEQLCARNRCGAVQELSPGHSEFLLLVLVVRLLAQCSGRTGNNRNNCSWCDVKTCGMARAMKRSNEPLVAAFAEALREARQCAGLTQEDLAERADVSVRFISLLETGKRQPSLSALAAISAGLRTPMSVLVAAIERRLCIFDGDADQPLLAELDDNTEIAD